MHIIDVNPAKEIGNFGLLRDHICSKSPINDLIEKANTTNLSKMYKR